MVKKLSPQLLYGTTAIILVFLGLIVNYSVDKTQEDAYLLFVKSPILFLFALLFFIYSGITLAFDRMRKPFNKLLFYIHYFISIIAIGIMISMTLIIENTEYNTKIEVEKVSEVLRNRIVLLFVIILCAQFVFIANMLKSVLQKTK